MNDPKGTNDPKNVDELLDNEAVSEEEAVPPNPLGLAEKVAESGSLTEPIPNVTFREHAARWIRDILPMYKFSVQESYRMILERHLVPRFGNALVSAGTPEAARFLVNPHTVQAFITEAREREYAPHTIHHFHEVLRIVLKYAIKWYRGLESNPAEGVTLPKLKPKTKPWALTLEEAAQILAGLADKPKARAAVWLLMTTGIRRGEYLAVRWQNIDEPRGVLKITEAYYRGHLDTPKTEAGVREVALDSIALEYLREWKARNPRTAPADFIFGTRNGKPDRPENLLHRHVYPVCDRLGIRRPTFLTFRRTFSTWSHYCGVPVKDIAALMGHAGVSTQFIYVQTLDDAKRAASERISEKLVTIGHRSDNEVDYVN